MSARGFAALVGQLEAVARRHAGGRLVLVTEGGYDLEALGRSLDAVLAVLERGATAPAGDTVSGDRTRGRASAEAARAALTPFWPGL
jgi:acetoin utilization deacetylase AcuC-like enzyme